MPELPEIETVKRSLSPSLVRQTFLGAQAYRTGLRVPFPDFTPLIGQKVLSVSRRSKYLLIEFASGTLLIHLGMSGSLSWSNGSPGKHDHLDLSFSGHEGVLRLRDPRRFGSVQFQPGGTIHSSLANLGPEPLEPSFTGAVLHARLAKSRPPIKVAIMDAQVVVGVGNIYATEALFRAGIDPRVPANTISKSRINRLVGHIKDVLNEGIANGGSTLRDFHGVEGQVGTFPSTFKVYGRAGQPCVKCSRPLSNAKLGGRASVFCEHCQK